MRRFFFLAVALPLLLLIGCEDDDKKLPSGLLLNDVTSSSSLNVSGGYGNPGRSGGSVTISGTTVLLDRLKSPSTIPIQPPATSLVIDNKSVDVDTLEGTTHQGLVLKSGAVIRVNKNDAKIVSDGDVLLSGRIETEQVQNNQTGFNARSKLTIEVTGNLVLDGAINMAGQGNRGHGGDVVLDVKGSVLIAGTIDCRGGNARFFGRGGNGGDITIRAKSGGELILAAPLQAQSGGGDRDDGGAPGSITLEADDRFEMAGLERIAAVGGASEDQSPADGGAISITSTSGDLTVNRVDLIATGGFLSGIGQAGAGGSLSLTCARRLYLTSPILDATGGQGQENGGDGGTIDLIQNSNVNPLRLDGSIAAEGGEGIARDGGAGGTITVEADEQIQNYGIISARPGPRGIGGTITLDATSGGTIQNFGTVLSDPGGTNEVVGTVTEPGIAHPAFTSPTP